MVRGGTGVTSSSLLTGCVTPKFGAALPVWPTNRSFGNLLLSNSVFSRTPSDMRSLIHSCSHPFFAHRSIVLSHPFCPVREIAAFTTTCFSPRSSFVTMHTAFCCLSRFHPPSLQTSTTFCLHPSFACSRFFPPHWLNHSHSDHLIIADSLTQRTR